MNSTILSKSDILLARTCPRCLWLRHNSTQRPQLDAARQQAIHQGHEFAASARKEFPTARRIPDGRLQDCAVITSKALSDGLLSPLFEPAFVHEGVGVKLDALYPTRGQVVMREFKASKEAKAEMLDDCAIQLWTVRGAGVPVAEVELGYLYGRYRKDHGKRRGRLVRVRRVTSEVERLLPLVPEWVALTRSIIDAPQTPAADPRHSCEYPLDLPATTGNPLALLARGKERNRLAAEGYTDILAIPLSEFAKPQNLTVALALHAGTAHVSRELHETALRSAQDASYLDFETVAFAVPMFSGTAPYEQVPVQFSCHRTEKDGELRHHEFLWDGLGGPWESVAAALLRALGETGPIFVYGSFEATVIKRLANRVPMLRRHLMDVRRRLVDLLPMLREGYYHPDMRGSYSIKAVLPTLPGGLGYGSLAGEVHSGADVQQSWLELATTRDPLRRASLSRQLRAYCGLDTLAMVRLVQFLSNAKQPATMENAA